MMPKMVTFCQCCWARCQYVTKSGNVSAKAASASDLGVIASGVCGWPESLRGGPAITRVSDGDTIQLLDLEGVRHKVRLAKIDAPESKQEWGREAAEMLRGLVGDKMVRENRLGLWAGSNVMSSQEWRRCRKLCNHKD